MSYNYGFPEYVPVGQKRAKAERKLAELRKKDPKVQPVIIEGSRLAHTWWGKAWNENLEKYADYDSRLGRGRSYIRHGAILDLRIQPGRVTALVQGSMYQPYRVEIEIAALAPKIWKALKKSCEGKLASLQDLLEGQFPKELSTLFTARETGLFPSPRQIKFDCSCPDWASMCKHVAAVLYGIGSRLDREPALFFELRKVDIQELITETVKQQSTKLLHKAKGKSTRILADENLAGIFGVDIDVEDVEINVNKADVPAKKMAGRKTAVKKAVKQTKKTPGRPATKKVGRPTAKKVGRPAKKKVGRPTAKKPGRPATKKAGRPTTKKPGRPTTKKTVKQTVKKTEKHAAKKATKQIAKKATKLITKKTARQSNRGEQTKLQKQTKPVSKKTPKKPVQKRTGRPGKKTETPTNKAKK